MIETASYKVIVVDTPQKVNQFNAFPSKLYKGVKNWKRPLDSIVEDIFNKDTNKHLQKGDIIRWMAQRENGEVVGRIAAFYTGDSFTLYDQPTGGVGFFDCINDQEVANLLFDKAKEWLISHKIEAMDGPTNPGMRDNFWGCLVDGFHDPVFNMNYNFLYYKELFENYGFKNYFNQYTYLKKLVGDISVSPVIERSAIRILTNPDYEIRFIKKGEKKFASDFKSIYNRAWSKFGGIKNVTEEEALHLLKEMDPIMDERLIIYAYHKGEPIAFFIMMPDIGQAINSVNGKWNWYYKIKFFLNLKLFKKCDRIIGKIFGVVPEFQGKGVEGAMIMVFYSLFNNGRMPYKSLELNWIGDFNPVMMKVSSYIGGQIYKTHVTYRYLFDRNAAFKRADLVNV